MTPHIITQFRTDKFYSSAEFMALRRSDAAVGEQRKSCRQNIKTKLSPIHTHSDNLKLPTRAFLQVSRWIWRYHARLGRTLIGLVSSRLLCCGLAASKALKNRFEPHSDLRREMISASFARRLPAVRPRATG